MTEVGTLKELNVQPGDVVTGDGLSRKYTVAKNDRGELCDAEDMYPLSMEFKFKLISRAKPTIDLTTNTSAWGLCSDEWRAAMMAHVDAGGEVERYDGEWKPRSVSGDFSKHRIYRAKSGPVVTARVNDGFLRVYNDGDVCVYHCLGTARILGTLTTTFHDGKPVKAEWVAK